MATFFASLLSSFHQITIVDILQLVIAGIMAWIAWSALGTWKQQIRAKRVTDFLDELTDAVHEYILSMSTPMQTLKFMKIGLDSYNEASQISPNKPNDNYSAAIEYIQKRGKKDSMQLLEHLETARPILSRMGSLVTKGQIFRIEHYNECQNAINMLTWVYDRIEAFGRIAGHTSFYWENPEVQKTVEDVVLAVNPEEMDKHLMEQNVNYLSFAKNAYRQVLK